MKVVAGLGNPGSRYDATRHNVGWWAVDRIAHDWSVGGFRDDGPVLAADADLEGEAVRLVKPTLYMNRSGPALAPVVGHRDFEVSSDLLVIVDDANLDVGRLRLRPSGGAGGHNGLRSVEEALGTRDYARLRIGVGRPPDGEDWTEWVLSAPPPDDEERLVQLLPDVTRAVEVWVAEGIREAMNRFNR